MNTLIKMVFLLLIIMFLRLRLAYNYLNMKHNHIIKLTQTEQQVFHTLRTYTQELKLNTVLRVAGGWVRDKIMGWESKDIDIALDNMKGEEFVLLLKKHAQTKNQKISSFGVTKINPDLSKHLETATAKISNQPIDFVNLRSQTYNNQSRIPIIDIGTPLQDALRRDFTINSLFFNINTGQIQDCTGRGLSDLQNKIIRTPLEPLVTFTDDPLRVLRCFRFKSRFDFTIDDQIYKSLENEGVHEALKTKVSKQRIGIELGGILKAPYILSGLWEIFKYNFWNIVFQVPAQSDLKDLMLIKSIPEYSFKLIERGRQLIKTHKLITQSKLLESQQKDKRQRYSSQQLTLMVNLAFITVVYRDYKVTQGKKTIPLIDHMARNQLKYSARVSKFVTKTGQLVNQLRKVFTESTEHNKKVRIIKWLRQAEEKWEIIIFILHAIQIVQHSQPHLQLLGLRQFILNQGYEDAYLVESFIDGTFLTKRGKKGPIIRTILENTIIWRILNPKAEKQEFLQLFEKNLLFFESDKSY